jgi:hypothetical protein
MKGMKFLTPRPLEVFQTPSGPDINMIVWCASVQEGQLLRIEGDVCMKSVHGFASLVLPVKYMDRTCYICIDDVDDVLDDLCETWRFRKPDVEGAKEEAFNDVVRSLRRYIRASLEVLREGAA